MLNTKDLCRGFAAEYGLSIRNGETIFNSVFDYLGKKIFEEKEDVSIKRFGTFKHKTMSPKRARHPMTGEMIVIPEREVVQFKQSEGRVEDISASTSGEPCR